MKRQTAMFLVGLLSVFGLLTACNLNTDQAQHHQHHGQNPQPTQLTITFKTNPTHPSKGESVKLISNITANKLPVGDAKVEFEVWKQGNKHEMIPAKKEKDGVYQAARAFKEDGQHVVVVHVTTPATHQMINATFVVGDPNASDGHASNGHHNDSGLHLHIEAPDEAKAGAQVAIIGHVTKENKPFADADVQFEYWKEGNSKHAFSDTAETKDGRYETRLSFPEPGTYQIKLHVEKGKVHDHTERTITIK
ncbi:FixH family protein [Laceyella putida]|uniref:FixH family protein n=1 Tax=Laceyella putida TaxID=110101 RepID=A0ABW2RNT8_9BACL